MLIENVYFQHDSGFAISFIRFVFGLKQCIFKAHGFLTDSGRKNKLFYSEGHRPENVDNTVFLEAHFYCNCLFKDYTPAKRLSMGLPRQKTQYCRCFFSSRFIRCFFLYDRLFYRRLLSCKFIHNYRPIFRIASCVVSSAVSSCKGAAFLSTDPSKPICFLTHFQ